MELLEPGGGVVKGSFLYLRVELLEPGGVKGAFLYLGVELLEPGGGVLKGHSYT